MKVTGLGVIVLVIAVGASEQHNIIAVKSPIAVEDSPEQHVHPDEGLLC